jgi:hypothetical protein
MSFRDSIGVSLAGTGKTSLRRHHVHSPAFTKIARLADHHQAVINAASRYPATVRDAGLVGRVLKSGHHNMKIGARVMKGRWVGMPIFTLTLEERATCPRNCRHFKDCFGNKMPFVERLRHGAALEWALGSELRALQREHPLGFVVRTHVLGDFYSVAYVRRWLSWLRRIPALRVFGYTAWPASGPIGALLRAASDRHWDRFAIRTSNGPHPERATRTLYQHPDGPVAGDAVVCPAQTGATACCATCGLCWQTRRNIAFLAH